MSWVLKIQKACGVQYDSNFEFISSGYIIINIHIVSVDRKMFEVISNLKFHKMFELEGIV